ncbi:MAG: ATP phosphoribosyltransferase regulatory subunit [Oscillospiraceae bacterium]|nr:ATP phosphoribosyltransferase regulatory subunit [Oscillospiraceae bacterium]
MQYTVNTPEGTRDRLFGECRERRKVQSALTGLFKRRGYHEIITPEVEYYDLFIQSGNPLPQESMLKSIDRSGKILVMRPDCTAPIARVAATKLQNEPLPQRLYYNQTIFRSGTAHLGNSHEIAQCGVELIGASGEKADAEMLSMAVDALAACGLSIFHIEIGHAGLFRALTKDLGAPQETVEQMRSYLEQKNFAALDDLLLPYQNASGYPVLCRLAYLFGGPEVLEEAEALSGEAGAEEIRYLKSLYQRLEQAGCGGRIQFDLGLAPQLDYYTGVVFRGYVEGAGSAVLSGGRYDTLLRDFGRNAPATGFAIDVDGVAQTLPPVELPKATQLVHYEADRLREALSCIESSQGACELSPCETLEETIALAKEKKMNQIIILETGKARVLNI